jgi:hypothetical protein
MPEQDTGSGPPGKNVAVPLTLEVTTPALREPTPEAASRTRILPIEVRMSQGKAFFILGSRNTSGFQVLNTTAG